MKNLYFLPFLVLIFTFSSCSEDESDINDPIVGKWSQSYFIDDWNLDLVTTMEFNSDGSMKYYGTVREPGSEVDLGYQFFSEGSFLIEEGRVSVPDFQYFTTTNINITSGSYVAKEELYAIPGSFGNRQFEVIEDNQVLLFPGGCGGDICSEDEKYQRID